MTQIPTTISPSSSAFRTSSEKAQWAFETALLPPRTRQLFEFCTQIVVCATLSLMTWIGEACITRDPGLKRFHQLKRYVDLAIKVLWTVRDKPERLTPAQLAWLRRAAETITHLFGRPLDFSPLDGLTDPAKPAKPAKPTPGDPNRPGSQQRPAQRRSASSDYCPPVPDSLDAKYVRAPGQVLATVCANLVRLMGAALPVQVVRDRLGQELALAQKEPAPQSVSVLGRAAFTRSSFAFILPLPATPPATSHHPPP